MPFHTQTLAHPEGDAVLRRLRPPPEQRAGAKDKEKERFTGTFTPFLSITVPSSVQACLTQQCWLCPGLVSAQPGGLTNPSAHNDSQEWTKHKQKGQGWDREAQEQWEPRGGSCPRP